MKSHWIWVAVAAFSLLPLHAGYRDYINLKNAGYSEQTIAVPEKGKAFKLDVFTLYFDEGSVRVMKPIGNGKVTGYYFEGKGRYQLTAVDPYEREQYERMSGQNVPGGLIEGTFDKLILRTNLDIMSSDFPYPAGSTASAVEVVGEREQRLLKEAFFDLNARITQAVNLPGDQFLLADMHTDKFDWLTFTYDLLAPEEYTLDKYQKKNEYTERWVSLDKDRDENGHVRPIFRDLFSIGHVDFRADLHKVSAASNRFARNWYDMEADITVTSFIDGLPVLPLSLGVLYEVAKVTDEQGRELNFVRPKIGEDFEDLRKEYSDDNLLVFLAEPLMKDKPQKLTVVYRGFLSNFASGRNWYPSRENTYLNDKHTMTMTFTLAKKLGVRASGNRVSHEEKDDKVIEVWKAERPAKMMGFTFGRRFKEEKLNFDNIPEVIVFGERNAVGTGNQLRNVAVDIAKSLEFYQWLFNTKLPNEHMLGARIESGHGQAFDGFIHLSGWTFDEESPGRSELFRTHEVAHQYWGHLVGWSTYRDQWISEAFAEYSAMMFLEATLSEKEYYEEILDAKTKQVLGELTGSRFAFPWTVFVPDSEEQRMGPIALGYRASTAGVPRGYQLQAYTKGPLVLHMIRKLLDYTTQDKDSFRKVLSQFVASYAGKTASTEDFKNLLNQMTGADWSQFFDQWIYGTAIPTYKFDYEIGKKVDEQGYTTITMRVKQENVPENFSNMVPVRLHFDGKRTQDILIAVNKAEIEQELKLRDVPKKLVFNPDFAVLAKMK